MANDISVLIPKINARLLKILRGRSGMVRNVNQDYRREFAKQGKTVTIPIVGDVNIIDVVPSNAKPAFVNHDMDEVTFDLDYWKQNEPIHCTDEELKQAAMTTDFVPPLLEKAAEKLARAMNQSIFALYKKSYQVYGTAGTAPFGSGVGVKSITRSDAILDAALAPEGDRIMMLNFTGEAAAKEVPEITNAEKIASNKVMIKGELGETMGVQIYADNDVPYHTAGTILTDSTTKTAAVNNGAGYAAGIDTINIDKGGGTAMVGTIVEGDIISFANHDQTYVVVENTSSGNYASGVYTIGTNAISGLKFFPALTTAVPDNTVITVLGSHRVNLLFHKNAFAFAQRVLVGSDMDGADISTIQDKVTKMILRLERTRVHKAWMWEMDALWGAAVPYPEHIVRVLG